MEKSRHINISNLKLPIGSYLFSPSIYIVLSTVTGFEVKGGDARL